jgi:hypothetical protein
MKYTNATKVNRKSGVAERRGCGAPLGLPKFWSPHADSFSPESNPPNASYILGTGRY